MVAERKRVRMREKESEWVSECVVVVVVRRRSRGRMHQRLGMCGKQPKVYHPYPLIYFQKC